MNWTLIIHLSVQHPGTNIQTQQVFRTDYAADKPPPNVLMTWLNDARQTAARGAGLHVSKALVTWWGWVVHDAGFAE